MFDSCTLVCHGRSVTGNSIADHLNYYGVYLRSEDDLLALQNSFTDFNTSQMLGFCKTSVHARAQGDTVHARH